MIIVTGGAGFVGSNLIKKLNQNGIEKILVVDNLKNGKKHLNLNSLKFWDFVDYEVFLASLKKFVSEDINTIFHQGACTDTMEYDGKLMLQKNYDYSKKLFKFAVRHDIRFLYASSAAVYGNGKDGFREERPCEYPLNIYAYSKFLFDEYIRRMMAEASLQIVGLRYFNVYGPQENHKEKMASVIFQFHQQILKNHELKLFEGSADFRRDFIWVGDVAEVNWFFFSNPHLKGIFNCGTGTAESFLKIGEIMQKRYENTQLSFIPFPENLREKYQRFTEADLSRLRKIGYKKSFTTLESGLNQYLDLLKASDGYWKT